MGMSSSLMMVFVAGIFERPWQLPMPGAVTWLAVFGLAALSTALAYIVFFRIMANPPGRCAQQRSRDRDESITQIRYGC